jgi:hypothetical protein
LSTRSLEGLNVGKVFEQGDVLATVGDYPVNGNALFVAVGFNIRLGLRGLRT